MCKSSSIALGDENELKIKGLPVENCLQRSELVVKLERLRIVYQLKCILWICLDS